MRRCILITGLLLATILCPVYIASAAMDTVYLVASDKVFELVTGMREYLAAGGAKVVHIKPEEIEKVKNQEHYIVLGSPDDKNSIGELIGKTLSEKQLQNARRMGANELLVLRVNGKDVMFFATSYSIRSLVQGTSSSWKELFEAWYNIPQSISEIIRY